MWIEHFQAAFANLSRHKLRSFLTALGIIFGIASVLSMISTGEGARRAILAQIGELGIRNIIINSVEPLEDQKVSKKTESWQKHYGLTFRDLTRLEETVPLVKRALPVREVNTWLWFKSRRLSAKIRGVRPSYFDNLSIQAYLGRTLTREDGAKRHRHCVIRSRLLREARYVGDPLAMKLKVGNNFYTVVGVLPDIGMQSTNQAVLGIDDKSFEIYVPFETVIDRYGLVEKSLSAGDLTQRHVELHQIVCEVEHEDDVLDAARCIQTLLARQHKKKDYQVTVPLELLASLERTQRVFNIVLPIISGISLLVGGIGILNIMLASITERTREIGIRRAIGATRADITSQFLIETITLSMVGGALGIGLGIGGVFVLEEFTEWEPVITAWSITLSLGISCSTGIVFGLYPARRAAMMNPIQALRHE